MAKALSPEELLDNLRPELLRSFKEIPEYGSLGFTVFMVGGQPSRIEAASSFSRKIETGGVNV